MSTLAQRPVLSDLVWNAEGGQIWLKRLALLVAGVAAWRVWQQGSGSCCRPVSRMC